MLAAILGAATWYQTFSRCLPSGCHPGL